MTKEEMVMKIFAMLDILGERSNNGISPEEKQIRMTCSKALVGYIDFLMGIKR